MTVLFLMENAGGGGAESFVKTLAEEYKKRSINCILGFDRPGPLSEAAEGAGLKTVKLGLGRKDFFRAPKDLARICAERHVDVIHAQFPRENVIALRAAKRCPGVEVVYTDHMSVYQGLKWRILNRIYCRRNAFAAAVWEGGRSVLLKNAVPADKIRVIPNGVSLPGLAAEDAACARACLAERFGVPEGAFVICSMARLSPEKGPDVLVEALAELKKITARQFFCIIAGEGPMEGSLLARAEELGISDCIRFAGRIDDGQIKAALLSGSDLYVNSSRSEAMSIAVLEAMSCGLAQVLTDVGAARELGCGLVVPPEDPQALAAAVKRIMEDEALRTQLSEKSLEAARSRYSAERMADSYLNGGKDDR